MSPRGEQKYATAAKVKSLERELKDTRKAVAGLQELVVSLRASTQGNAATIKKLATGAGTDYANTLKDLSAGRPYSE